MIRLLPLYKFLSPIIHYRFQPPTMKTIALLFLVFSAVLCENSFLNLKCKLSKHRQRISPYCRHYLGLEPTPPISTHLPPTTNTTRNTHITLIDVLEEVEEEMGGSPIWVIYLIVVFIIGYGGSVAFLKCKLNMSYGRSLRLGLTCSCVRGAFRPDAIDLPIPLQVIDHSTQGAAIES